MIGADEITSLGTASRTDNSFQSTNSRELPVCCYSSAFYSAGNMTQTKSSSYYMTEGG